MKITILGSAAAEAVPSLWCNCTYCRQAVERGGKDFRRRTAYLIDRDTLVDFGPDIADQCRDAALDWNLLERVLITHPHSDHCNVTDMLWRQPGYAQNVRPLEMLGTAEVLAYITQRLDALGKPEDADTCEYLKLTYRTIEPNSTLTSGDLEILAPKANHCPGALNFILRRGGKSVLIANDTAIWEDASWQFAAGAGVDLAIIDSTAALRYPDNNGGHMGVDVVCRFRDRLLQNGILKPDGMAIANHFSHNGNSLHADLEAFYTPHGIAVGYDGMTIEL
ncbi:MAG: hypothetical protein IJC73_04685 [Lentisphaeria bacterium]|nr:hypothetical protein [Lentisphaeria bacterium]